MKLKTLALILCLTLFSLCASAEELSPEQINYIKGALGVPRDIAVTKCDCYEIDDPDDYRQGLLLVNLYSNDEILAGAALNPNTLIPEYDIWEYSDSHVNLTLVEHQRAGEWSEADASYLKAGFHIPWNVASHCTIGEPYFWDGGGIWLTPVGIYAGAVCRADTVQEECLAGASIESDSYFLSMVRDIWMYSPD